MFLGDIDLRRNLGVMAVFFLTPAFLFTAFMVDAAAPPVGPVDSSVVTTTTLPSEDDPFFAGNPNFHHEQSVPIQLVLSMLGASTFKAVMEERRTSVGAKSENILVAFSIPNCDPSDPSCINNNFTIFDQSATNFTVETRLVENSDLNHLCDPEAHKGRIGYIKFPGHKERPNGTAEYINYFVVYKCGTFVVGDFLAVETSGSSALLCIFVVMIVIGIISSAVWCVCFRKKTPQPAPEEENGVQLLSPEEQALQRENTEQPRVRVGRIREHYDQLVQFFETGRRTLVDMLPTQSAGTNRAPNTLSSTPGPSAESSSDSAEDRPTTSQATVESSPSVTEPKEKQSSSKTSEEGSNDGTDNKGYKKSDSSESEGKEETSL